VLAVGKRNGRLFGDYIQIFQGVSTAIFLDDCRFYSNCSVIDVAQHGISAHLALMVSCGQFLRRDPPAAMREPADTQGASLGPSISISRMRCALSNREIVRSPGNLVSLVTAAAQTVTQNTFGDQGIQLKVAVRPSSKGEESAAARFQMPMRQEARAANCVVQAT